MKETILLGALLAGQINPNPTFSNGDKDISGENTTKQEVFYNLSNTKKIDDTTYQTSSTDIIEALQNNQKEQIIKGVLKYFDQDVSFKLTQEEKEKLRKQMDAYITKYPNAIQKSGSRIILNLDKKKFKELFKILLEYLSKGKELKDYPSWMINYTAVMHNIEHAKGKDGEKKFFHQFGYFVMRITEEMGGTMTIGYYANSMIKIIENDYIKEKLPNNQGNGDPENWYPQNMLDEDIRKLPDYF